MATLYYRREMGAYYFKLKDAAGKWVTFRGFPDRASTLKWMREIQRAIPPEELGAAPKRPTVLAPEPPSAPPAPTLRDAAEDWLKRRTHVRDSSNERGQLAKHIFPVLGDMRVTEIHRRDVRNLVAELRGKVAPKTVRNIYGTLHKLFADLLEDEVIDKTPCLLKRADLPANRPRDPDFRRKSIFTRAEVERLITAPEVLEDRRVFYRILFLTGTRLSEASELRWRDLEEDAPELMRLTVARSGDGPTKTGSVREIPVVPLLAETLRDWKRHGFVRLVKRLPKADDPIVPNRRGRRRNRHTVREQFLDDLKLLGMRPRRVHDTRRMFISMCLEDGAVRDVLRRITHQGNRDILDAYTTISWASMCAEMRKLRVRGELATVHALPLAQARAVGDEAGFGPDFGPNLGPRRGLSSGPSANEAESLHFTYANLVTPPGVEPGLPA